MVNRGRFVGFLLALLAARSPQADPRELSVIELRHRPPEELIPLIRPLLSPADAAIPNRNQLLLKASPATLQEIRALLEQLDKAPHRLLITVSQNRQAGGETSGIGIRGRIDPARPSGSRLGVQGDSFRSETLSDTASTQQVQTLDGHSSVIRIGTEIPAPSPFGTGFHSATTGFSIAPRLTGSGVLIDIAPWSDRLHSGPPGIIETQNARTTLNARLGEWLEIGGYEETSVQQRSNLGYSTRTQESRIFLKIEDLDAGNP